MDHPIRLAPADLHRETLHRHRQFHCPHPLDCHPRGILAREIVEPRTILVLDRLDPLFLPPPFRVVRGQHESTLHRLVVKIVMVTM